MIIIKSQQEIEAMKPSGRLSAKVLRMLGDLVRPGISTHELNKFAEEMIRLEGGKPAFLGYNGYPASICVSINDQIVHGIPSRDVFLKDGDIVSIDVGVIVDGWVGDNAATFAVGQVSPELSLLLDVTEASLYNGIAAALVGGNIGDIGFAVQQTAEAYGFGVVYQYVGHGIGRSMHEDPSVPNYGRRGFGPKLREGMVIAIEPMINIGSGDTTGPFADGWTVFTLDGKPSAHFEHTVAITADGPLIITAE
ncbi:MAG: type I methionyl aminopeptidase [Coriobacteriia bacterium]|nr:type I methionyl aminopeptidase [Coriobacteriia bacterium]